MKNAILCATCLFRLVSILLLAAGLHGCENDGNDELPSPPRNLLVAWTNDDGTGELGIMTAHEPYRFLGQAMPVGADAVMRCSGGKLFVLSQHNGTVAIVDPETQNSQTIASVGNDEAIDVAVVDPDTAYVTRRTATHLLRVDIASGATTDAVDLSMYADDDGIPDLGMMAIHERRLFVQIRRVSASEPSGFAPPSYIAVVDLETEELVDTDPAMPGVQAIQLQGTAPKYKMQVISETNELIVSASGAFFDQGGIEVIDLEALETKGLVVREADGEVGADLGPFLMLNPDEGFLVFSTDFDLSSHLQRFTLEGGVDPPPELIVSVGYAVPALELDTTGDRLFFPDGGIDTRGIRVFDVATGIEQTTAPLMTSGRPSDILLACTD